MDELLAELREVIIWYHLVYPVPYQLPENLLLANKFAEIAIREKEKQNGIRAAQTTAKG